MTMRGRKLTDLDPYLAPPWREHPDYYRAEPPEQDEDEAARNRWLDELRDEATGLDYENHEEGD